jgi:hypothetical protein
MNSQNRLIFIKEIGRNKYNQKLGLYRCLCGNEKEILITCVKNNRTKSCGCLYKETCIINGKNNVIHGMSNSPEWLAWRNMKDRCYNENYPKYKNYGGRGIIVCDHWLESFENFYADIGDKPEPKEKYSIHRINNDDNYYKENCKWATQEEQQNNKSNNTYLEYNGKKQTIAQWSEEYNINVNSLIARLEGGWIIKDAITKPIRKAEKFNYNDLSLTPKEWSEKLGINRNSIESRLNHGWSIEKIVTKPIKKARKIIYNGLSLTSKQWGEKIGVDRKTIENRLKAEWSIEKTLTTPSGNSKNGK